MRLADPFRSFSRTETLRWQLNARLTGSSPTKLRDFRVHNGEHELTHTRHSAPTGTTLVTGTVRMTGLVYHMLT